MLFAVIVMVILASQVVPKSLVTFIKANQSGKVSLAGSYIFGDRMVAVADGKDAAVVNVFLVDDSGHPIAGRKVILSGLETITGQGGETNADGMAQFKLYSIQEGQFPIKAMADGVTLAKKVTVTFRN